MENQPTKEDLNNLNDNNFYNEIIVLENLNSKELLNFNNLNCDFNSSLYFLLKENIYALRQDNNKFEKEKDVITNELLKNTFSDRKPMKSKEKKFNKDPHIFKCKENVNPKLESTENTVSDNIFLSKRNTDIFKTRYYKNRGIEPVKKAKLFLNKKHNRGDFDNLQTKIQVHFINFLINFINDIVHTIFNSNNISFKDINYEAKKKINHSYIINIFQKPIKDIITEDITKKYKTLKKQLDYNKKLYEQLTERSKLFKDFLEMKYINFFELYYYNKNKPLDIVTINDKTIVVSNKTKSFHHLLNKEKELNDKMNDLVKNVYFNGYNKENPFITTKCNK